MCNRNKAGGVMAQFPENMGAWLYFIKHKRHASTCTTLGAIGYLVYELSK